MGSVGALESAHRKWWKDGCVYQIYPASFKDSNDDGVGDIPGITSKLDYIASLGVDIIWISPHYESPQVDMGYDVSDYEKVYPPYGDLADMDVLIQETHARGMRLIVDLVVNHTSDQHDWFKASRSSKQDPKRDWYIWRPARYVSGQRLPPNNWRSMFCGSAWSWDEQTQEYYLHLFAHEQPDLNWDSPEARQAIYQSAMEFWLQRGVDGFRIDCVNMYSKGDLPDAPITDATSHLQHAGFTFCNGPRMGEFLDEMSRVLAKYDTMTVGECPFTPEREQVLSCVRERNQRLNMVFQFDVVETGSSHAHKFEAMPGEDWLLEFKDAVTRTQKLKSGNDGWTTTFLENHDWSRSISRFASDAPEHRVASGKMLALMLATLSGTLFLYQGQELGMINAPSTWSIDEFKDVDAANYYKEVQSQSNGDPTALREAVKRIQFIARDNARTPMQWNAKANAGFSEATPWMRVMESHNEINVEAEENDEGSVLTFWRAMVKLRKAHVDLLVHGEFETLDLEGRNTFTYKKTWGEQSAAVALNFSSQSQPVCLPKGYCDSDLLLSTAGLQSGDLAPYEGRLYLRSYQDESNSK